MSVPPDTRGDDSESADRTVPEADTTTIETPDANEVAVGRDALFHILRNERRRRTLRVLLAAEEEPVTMRAVSEAVAAEEYDTTVDALSSDERQRVYITLYQSHLPQMADAGIIEYDQDRGLIYTTPCIGEFEAHIGTDGDAVRELPSWLWSACAGMCLGIVATVIFVQSNVAFSTLVPAVLVALTGLGIGIWSVRTDVGLPSWLQPPVGDP